jgi:indolepyruvate ferredoxin oxidoreductase alpha subunit
MEELLSKKGGKRIILLGNEAICRGALEAGVNFVSTYPGTPATEVGDTFARISKTTRKTTEGRGDLHFEYSVNEKVALEAAAGAAFSGQKALCAMKHFGANVAQEILIPLCHSGVPSPLVIVVADDPNCWSSAQSEQNSRALAFLAHIPILEPSDPQECKDFTKLAFEISEKFKIPVMIRTTTRVSHQRGIVKLSSLKSQVSSFKKGGFIKNPEMFVTMPPRVLEMKKELLAKIEKIRELSEKSKFNQRIQVSSSKLQVLRIGIITSGISYLYIREALKELHINLPVLKLGFFYPLPEKKIRKFIRVLKKILVVEELESYLEKEVERLAKETNPRLRIFGKSLLPPVGELRPEYVVEAIAKISGKKLKFDFQKHQKEYQKLNPPLRTPDFCPGCYYRLVLKALKEVAPQNTIFGGDIGCYMLAGFYNLQDYLYCMGSSIGIAHGIKKATNQKVVALIGDSTFFHAGIPALINTVFNKSNPLIIVMDNQTTAMTGHQRHPGGIGKLHPKDSLIKIEKIVKACGVKNVAVVDPLNYQKMKKKIKEFLKKKEVSVIVARRLCWLLSQRIKNV